MNVGRERLGSLLEREAIFDEFDSMDRSARFDVDGPRWVEAGYMVGGTVIVR